MSRTTICRVLAAIPLLLCAAVLLHAQTPLPPVAPDAGLYTNFSPTNRQTIRIRA